MALKKEEVDVAPSLDVPITARSPSAVTGKQSQWKLTPLAGNVDRKWIAGHAQPRVAEKADGGAGGWTNIVHLSQAGGERHELEVTGPGGKVVKDIELVSTRRIPITVYTPKGPPDPPALAVWRAALPDIRKAFKAVGITLDVTEATMDKEDAGRFAKGLDEKAQLSSYVPKFFDSNALPPVEDWPAIRIFLAKRFEMLKDVVVVNKLVNRPGLDAWNGVIGPFPFELPQRALISATIWSPTRKQHANIKANATQKEDHFLFDLSTQWKDTYFPTRGGDEKGTLTVKFDGVESGYAGWSDEENLILITSHDPHGTLREQGAITRMAIHEIGHALGQVQSGNIDHSKSPPVLVKSGKLYTGHGGMGNHCRSNAEPDPDAELDPNGERPFRRVSGAEPLCIMYNDALHADAGPKFCSQCALNLKLADLNFLTGYRRYWVW